MLWAMENHTDERTPPDYYKLIREKKSAVKNRNNAILLLSLTTTGVCLRIIVNNNFSLSTMSGHQVDKNYHNCSECDGQ